MRLLPRTPLDTIEPWFERIQAWLLLFPSAAMLWFGPRAPLAGDPYPELTGAAIAAHLMVPALAWALLRRAAPRVAWIAPLLAFVALGLASRWLHPPTDALEADRALLLTAAGVAALLTGASLRALGRAAFVRSSTIVALLALLPALFDERLRFAGILGNSGSTSEIAVIGAVAGAWLFAREESAWRWLGGATALAHALYCGLAPALSGVIVLGVGLLVTFAFTPQRRLALGGLIVIACVAFGGARIATQSAAPSASSAVVGNTGGLEVRQLIWRRSLSLIGDHAALGVGPGQFAAAFPPYRDPREIQLSSHGRTLRGVETEVEHAHNDVLQGFADTGIVGGLAWLVFLGAVAWKSWRALRERDETAGALAVMSLALLCNACAREPLLSNPASSIAAFAVFGALLGRPLTTPRVLDWRMLAIGAPIVALLALMPRVLSIEAHGSMLTRYLETRRDELLAYALAARPDAVDARELDAWRIASIDEPAAHKRLIDAWRKVLDLRPHRFGALMQLGGAYAKAGRFDEARATWKHAHALDPQHSGLAFNLALMEANAGAIDEAESWLERAQQPKAAVFAAWGVAALRELDLERGWQLLGRSDPRFAELTAERAHDIARNAREGLSDDLAKALEGSAHVTWARGHAAGQRYGDAVRSYRQAKRCLVLDAAPDAPPRWSASMQLEFAAALALDGKLDDARRELAGVEHGSREWLELPPWAGEALLHARLLGN